MNKILNVQKVISSERITKFILSHAKKQCKKNKIFDTDGIQVSRIKLDDEKIFYHCSKYFFKGSSEFDSSFFIGSLINYEIKKLKSKKSKLILIEELLENNEFDKLDDLTRHPEKYKTKNFDGEYSCADEITAIGDNIKKLEDLL